LISSNWFAKHLLAHRQDPGAIRTVLTETMKAFSLASGIDLDKLTAEVERSREAESFRHPNIVTFPHHLSARGSKA
jgi:hypothetical protein